MASLFPLPTFRVSHLWRRFRFWLMAICTTIAVVGGGFGFGAQAQNGYPAFLNPYVNDHGQVLATEEIAALNEKLRTFEGQSGVHTVLLTVNSIHDYGTGDATIESFATNLFNTWGIGDANRNDGILVLVAPGDRKVRIELGSGYPAAADRTAQRIIDGTMLPHFRENRIREGTIAGVEAVLERFDPNRPEPNAFTSLVESVDVGTVNQAKEHGQLLAFLGAPFVFLFGSWRGIKWLRLRKRKCPHCLVPMERLDEQQDDEYLAAGQRQEEMLKSVDYDVWLCGTCGHTTVLPYTNYLSRYQKCKQCKNKTLSVDSRTISSPTYTRTGTAEVTEDCHHCHYHNVYTRTIPKRTRSSSSSGSSRSGGSSGGGGRSSGGGASGSW